MTEIKVNFDDAAAYDYLMGRWSHAIGERFLDWLAPPAGLRWLDVGCGSGAFTQLVLQHAAPGAIVGVDPAPAQVAHASQQTPRAEFRVADAMSLPFADGNFDIVVSALVINFVPDSVKAFAEMCRVLRPGGTVAGYLWARSGAENHSPFAPIERGLESIGADVLRPPMRPESTADGATAALQSAGFRDIAVTLLKATRTFRDFDDFWDTHCLPIAPPGQSIAALSDEGRRKLQDTMRSMLPAAADGSVSYSSRALAFKARKPA
jgi:ubiquinone/menaquinone biosynthesis C-methylase UbiE